jgi:hypothetical protein
MNLERIMQQDIVRVNVVVPHTITGCDKSQGNCVWSLSLNSFEKIE